MLSRAEPDQYLEGGPDGKSMLLLEGVYMRRARGSVDYYFQWKVAKDCLKSH